MVFLHIDLTSESAEVSYVLVLMTAAPIDEITFHVQLFLGQHEKIMQYCESGFRFVNQTVQVYNSIHATYQQCFPDVLIRLRNGLLYSLRVQPAGALPNSQIKGTLVQRSNVRSVL